MKKFLLLVGLFATLAATAQKKKTTKKKATKKTAVVKKAPTTNGKAEALQDNILTPEAEIDLTQGRMVEVTTNFGVMVLKLYDSTPLHRDNFIKLVQAKFYDSLLFHRIIAGFMIQGGDPQSKYATPGVMLGNGGGELGRIPGEFKPYFIHKKGVLAAARDGNPERASSACQFYIVQGKKMDDNMLNQMEQQISMVSPGFKYTVQQRNDYKTKGGSPWLDMNYTIFGEILKGLDVIDKIAAQQKDQFDRPMQDIRFSMRMLN
jgi:cyclophilin family peptidyl-prolyl cis-trans isomerase